MTFTSGNSFINIAKKNGNLSANTLQKSGNQEIKIINKGDINSNRFPNASKLARFAGIAPFSTSSNGKGKELATKQGNRRMQSTMFFLALQMIQKTAKGTPRNPVFREYYEKKLAEGMNGQQALICISRRLINIVYGMLKNGTEYQMPKVENSDEKK